MDKIATPIAFAVGRCNNPGSPPPLRRKDAERQRKHGNIRNVQIDRSGNDILLECDLHLRAAKIVMRMLGVARRVRAVRNKEDVGRHLFDFLTAIVPIFDFRFADVDLSFLCLEVVRNASAMVCFASIDQIRAPAKTCPCRVGRIGHALRVQHRSVPVDVHHLRLQAKLFVLNVRCAKQIHCLGGKRIHHRVLRRVRHDGIYAGDCSRSKRVDRLAYSIAHALCKRIGAGSRGVWFDLDRLGKITLLRDGWADARDKQRKHDDCIFQFAVSQRHRFLDFHQVSNLSRIFCSPPFAVGR